MFRKDDMNIDSKLAKFQSPTSIEAFVSAAEVDQLTELFQSLSISNPGNEEESTPKHKSLNHALFNRCDGVIIMEETKRYISAKELMNFRLVSTDFLEMINRTPAVRRSLLYHIDGHTPSYSSSSSSDQVPPPIKTLLEGTFRWAHLKFSNMDVSKDLIDQENLFYRLKVKCQFLKSLTFDNVKCEMGSFIQLVACCPQLIELTIANCPSMFSAGVEVLFYYRFMDRFHKRLTALQHLSICDTRLNTSVINLQTMQGWLWHTTALVSLDLRLPPSGTRQLPISDISKILSFNKETLRHLALVGNCSFDESVREVFTNLKLTSLTLGGTRFCPEPYGLGHLLMHQTQLERLHLFDMEVHETFFPIIGRNFSSLKKLCLESVVFQGQPVTEYLHGLQALTELTLLGNLDDFEEVDPWIPLFKTGRLPLTTLNLRFESVFKILVGPVFQTLKSLSISGPEAPSDTSSDELEVLTRKVMRMTALERLEITGTPLKDSDFPEPVCHYMTGERSFFDLSCLVFLNLSQTLIGDDTLLGHLLYIPNLQVLWINETQVSFFGIGTAADNRRLGDTSVFKNLREISARDCPNLKLNAVVLQKVEQILKVKLFCDGAPILKKVTQNEKTGEDGAGDSYVPQVQISEDEDDTDDLYN